MLPRLARLPRWFGLALVLGLLLAGGMPGDGSSRRPTPARGVAPVPTATGPVAGETYAWRRVAIGGGGFITGYDADPTGRTRVVRADVYGAYLWRDDLDRWVQLVNSDAMPEVDRRQNGVAEGVFEIVVAPSNPERIYMAVKGLVYRSDDRGARFVATTRAAPFPLAFDANGKFRHEGPFLAVSPTDPDLVLFGTPYNGLWRSTDAGATWTRVESIPADADLRPRPGVQSSGASLWFEPPRPDHDHQQAWAMVPGHGMYVSADGGRHFSPLTAEGMPQPLALTQGVFAADGSFFGIEREGRRIWRFRSSAWADLTAQIGPRPFASVAINPRDGQIFVFDAGGRAWRSASSGESWWPMWHSSRAGEGDPPWLRVSNQSYFAMGRTTFDPVVPNRLWVGAGTGVYYADLSELPLQIQWISRTRGIEELVANDVVKPPGHAPLFAALDFGIHVRDDLDRYSEGYGPRERVLIAAQQLAWSPADAGFVVTNASDTRTECCAEDGEAVLAGFSRDGGRSWKRFANLPQPPGTDAADPWRMSFGTIAVSAGDTANIVWEPSFNRSPFFTRDRGASWQRVSFFGETLPNTGSHALYYYHRKTLAADRVENGVFYLVHSGEGANAGLTGLWATRDGGERWHRVFAGEIAPQSQYSAKLRAVPGHAGHLFFTSGVAAGDDTRLRRSRDGGASWMAMDRVVRVDDIGFGRAMEGASYPTIFISGQVGGRYGVWRSTDDAVSWEQIGGLPVGTLDQVTVVAGDPDSFGRVYLGYKGSGWIYGQPASCNPHPYRFPDEMECYASR